MNPNEIPPEILALQQQAAAQLGAAILISVSFLVSTITCALMAFNLRRTALALFAFYGFAIFWIPSSITLYCGPIIFVTALCGLIFGRTWGRGRSEPLPDEPAPTP